MQHHPERLYDAINANELGAIITEHRNLLLCSLLRPMLDTFEREGIQLSAVLRALATLAQERSRTLSAADSSNPWLQCEALLAEAQTMAEMAEQRPKVTGAGTADGNNGNAVLDYLAQTGSSQGGVASFGGLTQPDPQGEAIASDSEGLEAELEGLDISRITANLDLSRLGDGLDDEFDEELEADLAAARESGILREEALLEATAKNGVGVASAEADAPAERVDWSQGSEEEAWARELLEEN